MTLCVAWVRKMRSTEQLIIASDSRWTGGETWDYVPKLFPLPRKDCALCFAGTTSRAYAIMIQVYNSIIMHDKTNSRALDITDVNGYLLDIVNQMVKNISDFPSNQYEYEQDFSIIFAGYSWRYKMFKIWRSVYDDDSKEFKMISENRNCSKIFPGVKHVSYIGDEHYLAMKMLHLTTHDITSERLGMSPLIPLVQICEDARFTSIGGAVQMLKIYSHMNILPHNVLWKNGDKLDITYFGRPLLAYERN